MKRIIFCLIIFLLLGTSEIFAQTNPPARNAIPTSDEIEKIASKIDLIKDKVASRVAELNLVERRGIVGIVEDTSDTKITVTDLNDKIRIIDVDELTKFSSEEDNSFGISDIKKGSKISSLGLYNKESQRLLARFINEISIPLFLHGVISEIDQDEFTVTLLTEDGTTYTIDIEKITKTFNYDDGELASSGFTKIKKSENAIVLGFPDPKKTGRLTASRIITFPDIPSNPKVQKIDDDTKSSPTPTKTKE